MSRRSITTIVVGVLLVAITLGVSVILFRVTSPSSAEIMESPQIQVERYQRTETIQTTFIFLAVLELILTGMFAYRWRRYGLPQTTTESDEIKRKESLARVFQTSLLTGLIAFITSYVAALLSVYVFDIYGGLNTASMTCLGVPAVVFGMLGGFILGMIRRKSAPSSMQMIPVILLGVLAGLIPGMCAFFLPQ